MKLKRTGSRWDRNQRININDNWDQIENENSRLSGIGKDAENTLKEALRINAEAERVNKENVSTQEQVDELILHAGQSDAEVIQARGGLPLLKDRLDESDAQLSQNSTDISNRVRLQKEIQGGQIPEPIRAPILAVEELFPTQRSPYKILWVEDNGTTIYASGFDSTFRKSTDGGKTWEAKGYHSGGFSNNFLKTDAGTLLSLSPGGPFYRSIDDGSTWTQVFSVARGSQLGTQSWTIDRTTGYIYFGEYITQSSDVVDLYVSKDDGLTWTVFKSFTKGDATVSKSITHIHAVQYDNIDKRIIVCTGDGTEYTGLWRMNDSGTDLEKILTNDMLTEPGSVDSARCIGIIPFENYLVWAGDTTQNPYVFRMHRSEIGKESPVYEKLYRLNSTAWFTTRASNDGKTWVISASEEGSSSIDNLTHLYAITDEGETIWECGTLVPPYNEPAGSLMPIGLADIHGENLWLTDRNIGNDFTWKFRMGHGFGNIQLPEPLPNYKVQQTFSTSGEVTLAPGEEYVFGITRSASLATKLYILEVNNTLTDQGSASTFGYQKVIIRKQNGEDLEEYINQSERRSKRLEHGNEINILPTSGVVEFVVKNTHTHSTLKMYGAVTFAWG